MFKKVCACLSVPLWGLDANAYTDLLPQIKRPLSWNQDSSLPCPVSIVVYIDSAGCVGMVSSQGRPVQATLPSSWPLRTCMMDADAALVCADSAPIPKSVMSWAYRGLHRPCRDTLSPTLSPSLHYLRQRGTVSFPSLTSEDVASRSGAWAWNTGCPRATNFSPSGQSEAHSAKPSVCLSVDSTLGHGLGGCHIVPLNHGSRTLPSRTLCTEQEEQFTGT